MSEIPPMSPPPEYAAYPRNQGGHDVTKLRALADGYFGLSWVFAINVGLAIAARLAQASNTTVEGAFLILICTVAVLGIAIGFLSYPHNKKIAYGLDWPSHGALLASILMGLNSALCCGIIGYVVVQTLAANGLKRAGIVLNFFSRKKDVISRIDALGQPPLA